MWGVIFFRLSAWLTLYYCHRKLRPMAKLTPISGFPEWLPQEKILEDNVVSIIRSIYESHGYTPIETRSVEPMSVLASKGDVSKEIYAIERATADKAGDASEGKEDRLALHFDLTIPFARYVAQNLNELVFPFKRYQLQRSWRGERPQEGRFREFYQFDVDVVSLEDLPLCHDAEMISIIYKAFTKLGLGDFQIKINNRKLLLGIYEHFGLNETERQDTVIAIDKIDKIGPGGVKKALLTLGLKDSIADEIIKCAGVKVPVSEFAGAVRSLGPTNELYNSGVREITEVLNFLVPGAENRVLVDLSLARGLDYYTGTIIETVLTDHRSFGSVAGGGRYENLTSRFGNKNIPGVGISIGITRLMSLILAKGLLQTKERCPTRVLISLLNNESMTQSIRLAEVLRSGGVNTEVFHKPSKLGKQIEYADKKGIPFVAFANENNSLEIKDLTTKEQKPVTIEELLKLAKK